MIFNNRNCNYPQPILAKWWLTQLRRWGMTKGAPDYNGVTRKVMRPDIYREAMKELGVAIPAAEETSITLFDSTFDIKADPEAYVKAFKVHSIAG